jgi:TfoX/Sxy family transcriptional regulator of competence genes
MSYDERLADRVRTALSGTEGISERRMFGGIAFLVDGKMCVGVLNDELVVRVGPSRNDDALKRAHTRQMDFTGRPMRGMIYVSSPGLARGATLRSWIEQGIAGARAAATSRARRKTAPIRRSKR